MIEVINSTQLPVVANFYIALALPTRHVESVVCLNKKNTESQEYVEIGIDAEDYYRIKDK